MNCTIHITDLSRLNPKSGKVFALTDASGLDHLIIQKRDATMERHEREKSPHIRGRETLV